MSLKISNAASPLGEKYEDLLMLQKSKFDRILTKTCTLKEVPQSKDPLYISTKLYSINNFGLVNYGYAKYASYSFEKDYTISVTGTYEEILEIVGMSTNANYLEFNVSCPNSDKGGVTVSDLAKVPHRLPFGVKLPPLFELVDIEKMAKDLVLLSANKYFFYIVCCNTIPFETGGLGGLILKPISLYNIEYYYKLLPKTIQIWGCGGIKHIDDIIEYEIVGVYGVQMATAAIDNGFKYVDELIEMYHSIC